MIRDPIKRQAQEIFNRIFNEDIDAIEIVLKNSNGTLVDQSNKKTIIDESVTGTTYIGKAVHGSLPETSVWQIQKIVEASGIVTISWAEGNDNFDKEWDERASYTYS